MKTASIASARVRTVILTLTIAIINTAKQQPVTIGEDILW